MHRSGTSMVARILQECGVYLGEPDQLVPASPTNPEGHFEHVDFLYVNKTVLRRLFGSWKEPPRRLAWHLFGWRLQPLRDQARRLVREMELRSPWAWKDPRTSLTLPFWLPLVPDLRIVVCVREPLAVAESLEARDGLSTRSGLELWHAYYRTLLRAAPLGRVTLTAYESYFDHPELEIARLAARLELPSSSREIQTAAASVRPDLRRHRPGGELSPRHAIARFHAELVEQARV
jgi:hypothetical protein